MSDNTPSQDEVQGGGSNEAASVPVIREAADKLITGAREVADGADLLARALTPLSAGGGGDSAAVSLMNAGSPAFNFADELGSIDMRKMLAGPLMGAVDAQNASSLATLKFIETVGFTTPDGGGGGKRELVMVDFSHTRREVDATGNETSKDVNIRVPLLTILPIPSLRIDEVTVDFNVKLDSVQSSQVSDGLKIDAEVKAGWGPVSFKVSASYQRQTTTNVEVKREYTLAVHMRAVQDEMPAGLAKVLGILAV